MSNAIGQNATEQAISNSAEQWTTEMFSASATRAAERQAKGITRERQMLNRQKLIATVCADYRSHFAAIYGKTERLPSAIYEQIELSVDTLIDNQRKQVHNQNIIGMRRAFYHNSRDMAVTERVQLTGENQLSLKEQLFGCHLFIGQAEKRLTELQAKPNPDYDREKAVKQQIMKLRLTEQFIKGEMEHQEKLKAEAK